MKNNKKLQRKRETHRQVNKKQVKLMRVKKKTGKQHKTTTQDKKEQIKQKKI